MIVELAAIAAALLAILVWAGRRPRRTGSALRIARALFSAVAAAGAVVLGLRGQVIASVVLVGLAAYLAQGVARGARRSPPPPSTGMSEAEARSILGVGPDAGRAEIQAAWRRLMQRAHPDQGGSVGLAAQLNAARERLLR